MTEAVRRVLRRRNLRRGPVGLALGGGGARGIAHAGVLEVLDQYPVLRPSLLAGSSAGAVMAVLYGAGLSVREIREFAAELDWFSHVVRFTDILDIRESPLAGLLPNNRLGDVVNDRIQGKSFDDLPRDVAVLAADIQNRRRVIFTSRRVARRIRRRELERFLPPPEGNLPGAETIVISSVHDVGLAIRASCAVPGFFRPVEVAGMLLVDGGVVDQTPVDVVRAMGARFSVGVSLALSFMPQKLASPTQALSGTVGMLDIKQLRHSLALADIGFQVSGIETRSAIRPHQLDLIDTAKQDMNRQLITALGGRYVQTIRSHRGAGGTDG